MIISYVSFNSICVLFRGRILEVDMFDADYRRSSKLQVIVKLIHYDLWHQPVSVELHS